MELGTDSISTENKGVGKQPKTEKTPTDWEHTNEWGHNERLGDMNCRYWYGPNEWGRN